MRVEVVEECGAGVADVEVAGGRRHETDVDRAIIRCRGGADEEGPAEAGAEAREYVQEEPPSVWSPPSRVDG